jgi:hypothetical protein
MIIVLVSFVRASPLSIQNAPIQAQPPPQPPIPPRRTGVEAALLDSKCRSSQPGRFFLPAEEEAYCGFIVGMVSWRDDSNADCELVLRPFETWAETMNSSGRAVNNNNFLFHILLFTSLRVSAPTGHPQVQYTQSFLEAITTTADPFRLYRPLFQIMVCNIL